VPSVSGQRAGLAIVAAVCVVRGARAVFRGVRGSAWSGEGECDCGRGARTYVALTFALGSEPPPAIVRYVVGGGRCVWWLWDSDDKAAVARGVAFAGAWRFDDFRSTCSVIGCTGCHSYDQRFTSLRYSSCAAKVKQLEIQLFMLCSCYRSHVRTQLPSSTRMRWSAAHLACNHSKHHHEEEEYDDPKRHQHAPALRVAPFQHLIVGFDVSLA
jgi:hypothetical protein